MFEIKFKFIKNYNNKNYCDNIIKNVFNDKIIVEKEGINSLPINIIHHYSSKFCQFVNSFESDLSLLININNYQLPCEPQFLYSGYEKKINLQSKFQKYTLLSEIIFYDNSLQLFSSEYLNTLTQILNYHNDDFDDKNLHQCQHCFTMNLMTYF